MDGYAPAKPHFEILEVLASIAAYQDSKWIGTGNRWGKAAAWCIVHQHVIRGWYRRLFKRYDRTSADLSRRTLQYHLASLRRSGHLATQQRHTGERHSNKLRLRPSLYKFTARGRQWISRRAGWVANPVALLAAQKIAHSGLNFDPIPRSSLSRSVDKSPTDPGTKKTAALRRSTSSSTSLAVPPPARALVRSGAASSPGSRQGNGSASGRRRATPKRRA